MKYLSLSVITLSIFVAACAPPPPADPGTTEVYRTWAAGQAAGFLEKSLALAAAWEAGDRAKAEDLYREARVPYERIDPILDSLGDLDDRIDAQEGDGPAAAWGGFHKLEKLLWSGAPMKNGNDTVQKLAADARELAVKAAGVTFSSGQLANGVVEVLEEVGEKKVSGGTEPYSRTGLADVAANLEGVAEIWGLLGGTVRARTPEAARIVDQRLKTFTDLVAQARKTGDTDGLSGSADALKEAWTAALIAPVKASAADIGVLSDRLNRTKTALEAGDVAGARTAFGEFQSEWTAREALVRSLDERVYGAVEGQAGAARRELQETKPGTLALGAVTGMLANLGSLGTPARFSAWDAGIVLFREGLEALLVLAALLAFLGRTGQKDRTPWVWSGAALGFGASVAVAFFVSVLMTGWVAASTPELVEGITGLAAVVLMLTVGAWLHGKANIKNWNLWVKDRMTKAGNSGWALGLLAFLAVLREGGETVVFLWGMAGSLTLADLALGVGAALGVLAVLGVAVVKFSKRLPLNWFFPAATLLIYFLAVKILGQALGSLQASGVLSSTPLGFGSPVEAFGFNPSWETAVPQVSLALVLGSLMAVTFFRQAVLQWGPKGER